MPMMFPSCMNFSSNGRLMKVLIDADGCPVVDITIALCRSRGVDVVLIADTAHLFFREDAHIITVDQGSDSVDFALLNRCLAGDIVVTQDYGLAAMCLARGARVIRQDGFIYTDDTIDRLLNDRFEALRLRRCGKHLKGPKKRTSADDAAYLAALETLL